MRAKDFIKEERLDEFLPAIGIGAILTAVGAYLAVMSVYEVWKILDKNGYDPDKMSDEDWENIAWELVPLAIPVAGKGIGKLTKAMIPASWSKKLGLLVKEKMFKKTGGFKRPVETGAKARSKFAGTAAGATVVGYDDVLNEHKKGLRAKKYATKPKAPVNPSEKFEKEKAKVNAPAAESKASRKLCVSTKPDSELGASALSSCVSQGLRARHTDKKFTINKKRQKIKGKKVKGGNYGGPLPVWKGNQ